MSGLLEDKRVPAIKAVEAAVVALSIAGFTYFALNGVGEFMENHFHILDPNADHSEIKVHPGMLLLALMCFPILGAGTLALIIPIAVYVGEHAAFNDLHILRPDHFCIVLARVYRSWAATNGKLATKDL